MRQVWGLLEKGHEVPLIERCVVEDFTGKLPLMTPRKIQFGLFTFKETHEQEVELTTSASSNWTPGYVWLHR